MKLVPGNFREYPEDDEIHSVSVGPVMTITTVCKQRWVHVEQRLRLEGDTAVAIRGNVCVESVYTLHDITGPYTAWQHQPVWRQLTKLSHGSNPALLRAAQSKPFIVYFSMGSPWRHGLGLRANMSRLTLFPWLGLH